MQSWDEGALGVRLRSISQQRWQRLLCVEYGLSNDVRLKLQELVLGHIPDFSAAVVNLLQTRHLQ